MIDDSLTTSDDELSPDQSRRVKSSSLLWFISSRPYVPMADIRRRFGLATETGTLLFDDEGAVHIGLPQQAAETLLDLKRRQKVALQYDLEHAVRIAVGAYPLRIRLSPPAVTGRAVQQAVAAPPTPTIEEDEAISVREDAAAPVLPVANGIGRPQVRRRGRRR